VDTLDGFAGPAGTGPAALDDARKIALLRREDHAGRLAGAPLNRAIRACLEVTNCAVTLQEIIGDATARVRRDRELRALLDTAALTATDLAAEADEIGQALIQLELVGGLS
jgi:hypothetical protein